MCQRSAKRLGICTEAGRTLRPICPQLRTLVRGALGPSGSNAPFELAQRGALPTTFRVVKNSRCSRERGLPRFLPLAQ